MYKIDLHTHSTASPDGGISKEQYIKLLDEKMLDFVAVTDHNTIKVAKELHKLLGNKIIIGEEITTAQGEIVGLFLKSVIAPNQSLLDTVEQIKVQGGVVYVPHPFETVRKGIKQVDLDTIARLVDVVEVYNGRAVAQNKGPKAAVWARLQKKVTAASSDAHGVKGVGTVYTSISQEPDAISLTNLLSLGQMNMQRPPISTLLYPKIHRLRNTFRKIYK